MWGCSGPHVDHASRTSFSAAAKAALSASPVQYLHKVVNKAGVYLALKKRLLLRPPIAAPLIQAGSRTSSGFLDKAAGTAVVPHAEIGKLQIT